MTTSDRVTAAMEGDLPLKDLTSEELSVVNARLDANIASAVVAARFGPSLNAAGFNTVSLDERGRMVEHRPDGSSAVIE